MARHVQRKGDGHVEEGIVRLKGGLEGSLEVVANAGRGLATNKALPSNRAKNQRGLHRAATARLIWSCRGHLVPGSNRGFHIDSIMLTKSINEKYKD